jgi:hypothetical protein
MHDAENRYSREAARSAVISIMQANPSIPQHGTIARLLAEAARPGSPVQIALSPLAAAQGPVVTTRMDARHTAARLVAGLVRGQPTSSPTHELAVELRNMWTVRDRRAAGILDAALSEVNTADVLL